MWWILWQTIDILVFSRFSYLKPSHHKPNTIFNAYCRYKSVKSPSKNVGKPYANLKEGLETLSKTPDVPLPPSSLIKPTVFTILVIVNGYLLLNAYALMM